MQREIKFKYWCADLNRFIDISEEGLSSHLDFDGDGKRNLFFGYTDPDTDDWHDVTPLQYCGLKDRDGNEIYEGDIVEFEYEKQNDGYKGVVTFGTFLVNKDDWGVEHFCTGWHMEYSDKSGKTPITDEYEIIGNIHQNPELLK